MRGLLPAPLQRGVQRSSREPHGQTIAQAPARRRKHTALFLYACATTCKKSRSSLAKASLTASSSERSNTCAQATHAKSKCKRKLSETHHASAGLSARLHFGCGDNRSFHDDLNTQASKRSYSTTNAEIHETSVGATVGTQVLVMRAPLAQRPGAETGSTCMKQQKRNYKHDAKRKTIFTFQAPVAFAFRGTGGSPACFFGQMPVQCPFSWQ